MSVREHMPRLIRILAILASITLCYFLLSSTPLSALSPFDKGKSDPCKSANFQWRGANDKIYPRNGAAVSITHNDYSDGLLNHRVSVLFGRAPSEDFSIQTDIFTSHELPKDQFEISYARDELIINSMVPKGAPIVTDASTSGEKHCVVMKVYIMVPVSKPLTGIKLDFPQADVLVHESTAGALPYLDVKLGQGSVVMSDGQRLHTGDISLDIGQGSVEGKIMLTKSLVVYLQSGTIDVNIGFSPYLVGATIEMTQQSGRQNVKLENLFYRPTTGTYQVLGQGSVNLQYPKAYAGRVQCLVNEGVINLSGNGLAVTHESEKGVMPVSIEAKQGLGSAVTSVYVARGKAKIDVADPGKQALLEASGSDET